ncbi:MAG: HAMP domain-containing sensor histidine kinase [Lentisphaerae bacterium]|nr:HAMP domain-containing sensor histidine kinase [Lentisphaerota bacterium]
MLMEEHLQKIVQISLGTSPENMLKTSLEICTELAGGDSGSILGEEGPSLQFLFSDVEELIGVRVPFDSIAGATVIKNLVIYTYAPSDKRHFEGVDQKIKKQTNYLLSIPIPSIHQSSGNKKPAKNAGALQILFNENVFQDLDVTKGAKEFDLKDFKNSEFYSDKLKNIFWLLPIIACEFYSEKLKNIFWLLPIIAFGMEVMTLRQTSYQVIHELKNKMISSLSWMRYLKEDIGATNPELVGKANIIEDFKLAESAVHEGAELAKNYLQFTKIYTPNFAPCNINDVLRDAASSAKTLASGLHAEGFDVRLELDEDIKNRELDAGKLKMAFYNLCKNAIEAMVEHRTEKPMLSFTSKTHDKDLLITIADNGPGMPKEIAENLFIPFKTKKEGGTGLGLTIAKKIIDLHVGTIKCNTGDGGTEFVISI